MDTVQRWLGELAEDSAEESLGLRDVEHIRVHLYGSLALTGKGHATDQAIALALLGHEPETVDVAAIAEHVHGLARAGTVELVPGHTARFEMANDIVFHIDAQLPGHANGMTCEATSAGDPRSASFYSVGGGFVVGADEIPDAKNFVALPHPAQSPDGLLDHCTIRGCRIADVVWTNEQEWRSVDEIRTGLRDGWAVMLEGVYRGCHTDGVLPGGLDVRRRVAPLSRRLLGGDDAPTSGEWVEMIQRRDFPFAEILQWVSTFAMAVNEENADLGRVVMAPTNGAALPRVLLRATSY